MAILVIIIVVAIILNMIISMSNGILSDSH